VASQVLTVQGKFELTARSVASGASPQRKTSFDELARLSIDQQRLSRVSLIESDHLVLSALVIANIIWDTPVSVVLILAGPIRIIRFTIWFFGNVNIGLPPFKIRQHSLL
jgi:hypothetical protein